jgi:Arc/MetJ-type ribon-helix-helix transcriptional regulator
MMSRINVHMTPGCEHALKRFMHLRRLRSKSEAVRVAVEETLARDLGARPTVDYTTWLGRATRTPGQVSPRFRSHDDLWER